MVSVLIISKGKFKWETCVIKETIRYRRIRVKIVMFFYHLCYQSCIILYDVYTIPEEIILQQKCI